MLMSSRSCITTESTAAPPLLLKLAFEVAILGSSTMALFQQRKIICMSPKDWQCLDMIHRRYYKGCQEAVSVTSPLLQGHTALFILLLRLVHVSRMDGSVTQQEHLTVIEHQLATFERERETAAAVCADSNSALNAWETMWQYVTIILRIYLTSLQQPHLCSNSPQISALALKGLQTARQIWALTDKGAFTWSGPFTASNTGASRNIAGCTVAFVLTCATNDYRALKEIQVRLNNAKRSISTSHYEKLARIVDILVGRNKDKLAGSCTAETFGRCQGRHDGLDLLRLPRGPFGVFDLDSVGTDDR
jgi:hypothetical protein